MTQLRRNLLLLLATLLLASLGMAKLFDKQAGAEATFSNQSINFKALPGYIVFKNKEGAYIWANTALTEFAGTDLVGKMDTNASISWHATGEQYIGDVRKTIESGDEKKFIEYTRVNGDLIFYISVIKPTKDDKGAINGVAAVTVEVTPALLEELNQKFREMKP